MSLSRHEVIKARPKGLIKNEDELQNTRPFKGKKEWYGNEGEARKGSRTPRFQVGERKSSGGGTNWQGHGNGVGREKLS